MTEWQPIKTAPKDGAPFLIYSTEAHIVACYHGVYKALA